MAGGPAPRRWPSQLGAKPSVFPQRGWGSGDAGAGTPAPVPPLSPASSFRGQGLAALGSLLALAPGRMGIRQLPELLLTRCRPTASGAGTLSVLLNCSILYILRCLPPATHHLEQIVIAPWASPQPYLFTPGIKTHTDQWKLALDLRFEQTLPESLLTPLGLVLHSGCQTLISNLSTGWTSIDFNLPSHIL